MPQLAGAPPQPSEERRPIELPLRGRQRTFAILGAQRSTSAAGQQRGEAPLLNGPLHVVVGRRFIAAPLAGPT